MCRSVVDINSEREPKRERESNDGRDGGSADLSIRKCLCVICHLARATEHTCPSDSISSLTLRLRISLDLNVPRLRQTARS